MCRESWRKLGLAGKAPQPIRLSSTHSVYSNAEVHRWLADPLGYRADPGLVEAA
ncbi:transcriptional regulator [Burkholderia stagnalis]|nr:transcriptional regulator [Burkholderia stagnalis]RQY04074.1 transcriptional regulator [Burkholderia stagnalis]RQY21816.1 transcriptional regulator [Burkholderia stagnalis]RQY32346.1 transcriptional regulator [Burkholderia stagnalis]